MSLALLAQAGALPPPAVAGSVDGREDCRGVRGFILPSRDVGPHWSNDSDAMFLFERAESGVSAARSREYFQAAVAVSEEKRWANLNPSEPDRILDDALARSWLGRTMLEDDLRMKQTSGRYTDPRSETGKDYWDRLRGFSAGTGGRVSAASRFWIVPAGWTIEVGDDAVVVESIRLGVKTEAQYLLQHAGGSATPSAAPEGEKERQRLDALTLATVQPHVEKMVNEAEEYAAIRAAAQAVGVSILYRRGAIYGFHPFTLRFDREGVRDDSLPPSWSPRTTWYEYVKAFREGTYNVQHVEEVPGRRIVTTYFHGGVDLDSWPPPTVKPLSEEMAQALREPARVSRRLPTLRGWSHGTSEQVLSGGARACGGAGAGERRSARLAVGDDPIDRREDRLFERGPAEVGAAGRA